MTTTRLHMEARDGFASAPRMPYVRLDNAGDSRPGVGVWGNCDPAVNSVAVMTELRRAQAAGRPGAIHIGWLLNRCTNITEGFTTRENIVHGLLSGAYPCLMEIEYARQYLAPLVAGGFRDTIKLIWGDAERIPNHDAPQLFPGVYEAWKAAMDAMGRGSTPLDYSRDARQALVGSGRLIIAACGLDPSALCLFNCADFDNGWATRDTLHPPVNLFGLRPHCLATMPDEATTLRMIRNLRDTMNPARAVVHLTLNSPVAVNVERLRICRAMGVGDVLLYGADASAKQMMDHAAALAGWPGGNN